GGQEAWKWVPALVVFGMINMAMFAACHECLHNTAFKSRNLNQIALWLGGAAIIYTPTGFREFHFAHHRYTHDPERDPEISFGGRPAPAVTSMLPAYFMFLTGFPLMMVKALFVILPSIGPGVIWRFMSWCPKPKRAELRWQARAVFLLHAGIVTAGILWVPGLLWLQLGQLLGHCFLTIYITAEHNGLPHEGDVLTRTRTIRTNALVRFLMWNMPYHAEHHAYPGVPFHALPRLNALMAEELRNQENGYPGFHGRVLSSLLRGKSFEQRPGEA
ncbi:MAG: fatty acid desaturase, partial [Bacteroidota bacterium]